MNNVNHNVIKWARKKSGLNVSDAAKKLNLNSNRSKTGGQKLIEFESGEQSPSYSILKRMEKVYRVPLITFYLDYIPQKTNAGEDFRTLPETIPTKENSLVENLVSDIVAAQSTLKSALEENDELVKLKFINSINMELSVESAAKKIKEELSLNINKFRHANNTTNAFNYLREKVHQNGIFVILKGNLSSYHTKISVKNFRGFVLADEYVPFITINNNDSKAAWSFTLLHEVVHLFLGKTGIVGSVNSEEKIEVFCNSVASEILIENEEFENLLFSENVVDLKNQISRYANIYNISNSHIAYRLYKSKQISHKLWEELADYFKNKWLEHKKNEKQKYADSVGGVSPYVVKKRDVGKALLKTTKRMLDSGHLTPLKAGQILGVRAIKIEKMLNNKSVAA
jgi:Zn-dependent peptidase ImmA (M78 family)